MMNILLINPPYAKIHGMGYMPNLIPLNLCYVASCIRIKENHNVNILDAEFLKLSIKEVKNIIKESKADLVGMTTPTPAYEECLSIAKCIKELDQNIKVVLGGIHPTAFPTDTLKEKDIDYIIVGEGELTFYELISSLETKSGQSNIKGLGFKMEGRAIINKPNELIDNLDTIPFPSIDLLYNNNYEPLPTKRLSKRKATTILTSRGCPHRCTFCVLQLIWRSRHRTRSVKNVIAELEMRVRQGYGEFLFLDDTFTLDNKRAICICKEIVKKEIDMVWVCFSKVDEVEPDLLYWMKKAGCKKIAYGIESGSERILDSCNKKINLHQIKKAIILTKKHGIKSHGSFIIGNLYDTKDTINKTINFARNLDLDSAGFVMGTPYPGTAFYTQAKKMGAIDIKKKWCYYDIFSEKGSPLVLKNFKDGELLKLKRRAYIRFYLRPSFIIRRIVKIRSFDEIILDIKALLLFLKVIRP